jgi:hypothetical protein
MATEKMALGRICEYLVQVIIEEKTGYSVSNLNDAVKNHPATDLCVIDSSKNVIYEVSIKAKNSPSWPSVRGVKNKNQYMVFVDVNHDKDPVFYILNKIQWESVLRTILPKRDAGAEIVDGTIEWNWTDKGQEKKHRGSYIKPEDISRFKDNWSVLPGISK